MLDVVARMAIHRGRADWVFAAVQDLLCDEDVCGREFLGNRLHPGHIMEASPKSWVKQAVPIGARVRRPYDPYAKSRRLEREADTAAARRHLYEVERVKAIEASLSIDAQAVLIMIESGVQEFDGYSMHAVTELEKVGLVTATYDLQYPGDGRKGHWVVKATIF